MDNIENNKLIAEFIFNKTEINGVYDTTQHCHDHLEGGIPCSVPVTDDLHFDKSWDWLMPVVEKIESLGYPVKITSKYCSIARDYTYKEPLIVSEFQDKKITKVYQIVVGFIKYVNYQNQSDERNRNI